jgi:hypothetical protein
MTQPTCTIGISMFEFSQHLAKGCTVMALFFDKLFKLSDRGLKVDAFAGHELGACSQYRRSAVFHYHAASPV